MHFWESFRRLVGWKQLEAPEKPETTVRAEFVPIGRRVLTEKELELVRQILAGNGEWAGINIDRLFAVSERNCGTCRTYRLDPVETPHNPKASHEYVGGLIVSTIDDSVIWVDLHQQNGFLVELEMTSVRFDEGRLLPPEEWNERSRAFYSDRTI